MKTNHAGARIWALIAEPKTVTIIMTVMWTFQLGLGVWTVTDAAPTGTRDLMGVLLIVAGALGTVGCPLGQWWVERPAIIAAVTAFIMHLLIVVDVAPPDGPWEVAAAAGMVVLMATRWERIRGLPADPRKPSPVRKIGRGDRG